ncbi:MAG: TetR/AcrR family transcriptional regulator [Treponemataceae bacterium]|nr:TetR/AcrR family transcriptional regulator [Treponemataceae bacterium]
MGRRRISREKIVQAFLSIAFEKSAGATSLQDIAAALHVQKASLYNHFSSRDEMYGETLRQCREAMRAVNFVSDEMAAGGRIFAEDVPGAFRKIIRRYVNLYEAEPLFQMYAFIHSEQYFNDAAAEVADGELRKVADGFAGLFRGFSDAGKTAALPDGRAAQISRLLASALMQELDAYIIRKKAVVRRNPECGAGSLFALPPDDGAISRICTLADAYIADVAVRRD